MGDWERLFKPHILERGYEYFLEERVVDFWLKDDLIKASVAGTDDYEVVIEGIGYDFPRLYCDCPFADTDNNCKHMAAVLYEYEDGKIDGRWEEKTKLSKNVEEMVLNAEDSVVREFLIELLKKDQSLAHRFARLISPQITGRDIQQLNHKIDKIIKQHAGYENSLEYQEIENFVADLIEFINEEITPVIEKEAYLVAFQLINHIVLEVREVDIDDLEGELFELSAECRYTWESILNKATKQEREEMHSWFKTQLNQAKYYFGYGEIEQIYEDRF